MAHALDADRWGAFVERAPVDDTEALSQGGGPLAGVRVAVKDNIAVAGFKWTAGLPLFADRRARADAPAVAALKAAGASVAGVAVTDAAGFGMTTPGVINPLDPDLIAGGSSGGAAAAVAAGLADLGLGTDTGGSVRVPAACCGLFGFKPTFGRISVAGVTPLSETLDHIGLIAGNIDVLRAAAGVLLQDRAPTSRLLQPGVVGYDPRRLDGIDPYNAKAVLRALDGLAAKGCSVVEVELPERDEVIDAHGILACVEALEAWSAHWPQDAGALGRTVERTLAHAASIDGATRAWAIGRIADVRLAMDAVFEAADYIVGPVMMCRVPQAGARRVRIAGQDLPVLHGLLAETCGFNISGHPAIAVPLNDVADLPPPSIQVAGRPGADMALVDFVREAFAATRKGSRGEG